MTSMVNLSWLPPLVVQASERLAGNLSDLAGGATVWLAVTGLSRSGKTVFITSLIHNLLSALHNPNRMPLLNVVGERRLLAAHLEGPMANRLPQFPYLGNIEKMAIPDWPQRTADLSEIGIVVRFAPANTMGRLLNENNGNPASLTIRIVDYPGEWLLDLSLLGQSYADWSRATLRLMRKGVRAEISGEFLAFLGQHRAEEVASEEVAKQAHDLDCAYLVNARDRHGLSFLQPGRFLCPGSLGEVPYLWFAPIDLPDELVKLQPGSLGALMAERFEVYKREIVEAFYREYFRQYGRQIVLVDVLGALLAGRDAFEDTQRAMSAILQSFRYGQRSILSRLIGLSSVEK